MRTLKRNPTMNTDRELWRETPGDFYSPSLYASATGRIGINVGGHVIEKPLSGWHADACATPQADPRELLIAVVAAVRIEGSQKKAAAKFGISPQYLNDILKGNREIPDKVARHFGVRRVVRYEKLPEANPC